MQKPCKSYKIWTIENLQVLEISRLHALGGYVMIEKATKNTCTAHKGYEWGPLILQLKILIYCTKGVR